MSELQEVMNKINETRKWLNDLLEKKGDLLDPEVIELSQFLDKILNDYNKLLSEKEKNH